MPSPDGPARLRPRELRCGRRLADDSTASSRSTRPARCPTATRSTGPRSCATILERQHEAFARCLTSKLMTYALGRGLERYDTRTVSGIASRLPGARLPVLGAGPRNRQQPAVPVAKGRRQHRSAHTMIVTRTTPASPHVPQGHGGGHRAADARRDDAGVRRARRAPAKPTSPGVHLRAQRHHDGRTGRRRRPAPAFEFTRVLKPLEPFRKDTLVLSGLGAPERRRARRRSRRPRPRRRVVPDRRAPAQDRRRRHPERHLGRSDRGPAPRQRTRGSPRSSSGATTRGPSATATRAIRARTPTAWRGAARRRRCRRRPIRDWSSSACSATSTPASRRTSGRAACSIAAASSISSTSARRSWPPTSGPSDRRKLDEYLYVDPRDRAPHRNGRAGYDRAHADDRQADRRPGAVRRLRQADVRSAADRVPDRLDPRGRR